MRRISRRAAQFGSVLALLGFSAGFFSGCAIPTSNGALPESAEPVTIRETITQLVESTPPAPLVSVPPPTPETTTSAPIPEPTQSFSVIDHAYIEVVRENTEFVGSDTEIVELGHQICTDVDASSSLFEYMEEVANYLSADETHDFAFFLGASITAYCPRYEPQLDAIVNGVDDTPNHNSIIWVANNTGYNGWYLYVSPVSDDEWGSDVLGANVLMNGDTVPVELDLSSTSLNRYDFKLVDSDGDSYIKWDVALSEDDTVTFTFSDIILGTTTI